MPTTEQKPTAKFYVVDLDKTLVSDDTARLWHDFLDRLGFLTQEDKDGRAANDRAYKAGIIGPQKNDEFARKNARFEFALFNRIPSAMRERVKREFFAREVLPKISALGLAEIEVARAEGYEIILSTAAMDFIAEPVAAFIKADHCFSIAGKRDDKGEYTGEISGIPNQGDGKKDNIEQLLAARDLKRNVVKIAVRTDSHNDLPLVKIADPDEVRAVNPCPKLKAYATENNIKIVNWHSDLYGDVYRAASGAAVKAAANDPYSDNRHSFHKTTTQTKVTTEERTVIQIVERPAPVQSAGLSQLRAKL